VVVIAVLGVATLVAAGYLINQYRTSPDVDAVAGNASAAPEGSTAPAPALSGSILPSASGPVSPSASAPSPSASASASKKPQTPKRSGGHPNADNTGVPAGVTLATYKGPCTIAKSGFVIDGKIVNCDALEIRTTDVKITNSRINGRLVTTERSNYSYTLTDSEVNAGVYQGAAVGSTNMTILRSDIQGGQTAVVCSYNCTIRDSWLHGQELPDGSDWHLGGFLANDTGGDGTTKVVLDHNTIVCDSPSNSAGGGCSGNVNLFPDFGPVSGITVTDNLLGANEDISYCVYGGSTSDKEHVGGVRDIVFTGNVIQRGKNSKCGQYGPVTSFDPSKPGNRWANNRWDDGKLVESAN
jgi:hypothetical protein